MIYDRLDKIAEELPADIQYRDRLAEFLCAACTLSFEKLREMDFSPLDIRYGEYETRPAEQIPFEAHKKYCDLQIVMKGRENLGYAPLRGLTATVPYNKKDDIALYSGEGFELTLEPGYAVFLEPADAHRPGANCKMRKHVKKIVVKLIRI